MDGIRLATIFSNIAEVYKKTQSREKVFRLNVAARTIRDHPALIEDAYRAGSLLEMDGIDLNAAEMISEYIETGTIGLYEKIKSHYSEELIRFIRMSGLGSTRMFGLYEIFDIEDTEKLKEVLYDPRILQKAEKLGIDRDTLSEIHLERLKSTVSFYEKTYKKIARGYMRMFLPRIEKALYDCIDVEKIELVGSYRRKKAYLSDADMLILPKFNLKGFDPEKSIRALDNIGKSCFKPKSLKDKVSEQNISRVFETGYGFDIEIILSSGSSWVRDLFETTGSKRHVKNIMSMSEAAGMFSGSSQKYKDIKDEQDIYSMLGLGYIPPELREEGDIIDLAKSKKIPKLVELADIKGDLHIHSHYSDGLISREVLMGKARKLGYQYIGLSDHSASNRFGNGLDETRLEEKIKDLKAFRKDIKDIEVMIGSEVDIKGRDRLDYPDEVLEKLDVVLASMHSSYTNGKEENTARVLGAIDNPMVDIIAHPTGVVFGNRAPYSLDLDRILEKAASRGKAMEINSYYIRLDLDEGNTKKAKSMGVPIVINTDSHRYNNLEMISLGVDIARRARLTKDDVINTKDLKDFRYWKVNK